jgi:3-deoxy-D-manno-octulosonic-acid transferase
MSHSPDAKIAQFCGNDRVFIVGSCWPKDEDILLPVINKMQCKVIIAPHNVDEKSVQGITKSLKRPHALYTNGTLQSNTEVLVLDTIGHLSSAYSFGALAYIGGGFSGNLHNILEPAVFGMGVIIGPNYNRFPEAASFIKCGFGFDVSTSEELKHRIDYVLENKECIDEKAESFVDENRGASQKMYDMIITGVN